jgi:hypothetical protein
MTLSRDTAVKELSFDDESPLHQRRMTRNDAEDVILPGFWGSKRG